MSESKTPDYRTEPGGTLNLGGQAIVLQIVHIRPEA